MGEPAASHQYFLGIGGEQSGPFSEAEIVQQWKNGKLPDEALLWYEGLEEWKPAAAIIKKIVGETTTAPPPLGNYSSPKESGEIFSTFASKEEGLKPIFEDADANESGSFFLRFRLHFFLGIFILVGFLSAGGLYIYSWVREHRGGVAELVPIHGNKLDRREIEYRKAASEILFNSDQSIATLTRLIKENASDAIGKQAIETAIDFYRRNQKPHEIGRLLLSAKRPAEAAPYFLGESPSYPEALGALELALKEKRQAEFLIQEIEILLGPAKDMRRAVELIKRLESEFPKSANPFGFYLKTQDEQLADLFSRLSFYFVQSLLNFLDSELPQIHFDRRPLVELKRDKSGGYRIVGSYKGDVSLSRDPLKNIQLVFWIIEDRWVMVETNLTKERAEWAAGEKEKLKRNVLSGSQMFALLEQRFRTQFPKAQLHQAVKPTEASLKSPSHD